MSQRIVSALDEVKTWLSEELPMISAATHAAAGVLDEMRGAKRIEPSTGLPENLGLIVFGSLARKEWTQGSDVDWTVLIDGPCAASHFELARVVRTSLERHGYPAPGASGTFGALVSSHELVHQIGGSDDSNQNLTRRILLLLESDSVNDDLVRARVLRQILERYVAFDPSVSWLGEPRWRVPRFLLNDIVRYWRTIAVDYARKKWEQPDIKWALRNVKLRFSRKLLFVKGLLLCLDCQAGALHPLDTIPDTAALSMKMIERAAVVAKIPAIELLCMAVRTVNDADIARSILLPYDRFLGMLNDATARSSLANLEFTKDANDDPVFGEARDLGKTFQSGLEELFFRPGHPWSSLMRSHGVF